MRSRRLLLATCLCTAAFVVATVSAFADAAHVNIRKVDSSAFPVVSITVVVTGDAHPSDISVRENGADVVAPTVLSLGTSAKQVDVVLAIDTSLSMRGAPLAAALDAARSFVQQLAPEIAVGLLTYSDRTRVVQAVTTDHQGMLAAIDSVGTSTQYGTVLYDAVAAAAKMFSGLAQHNVILLTDGRDAGPQQGVIKFLTSSSEAVQTAQADKVSLFTVGFGPQADVSLLQGLASQTGGTYVPATTANVVAVYQQILTVLTSQFLITYRSHIPRGGSGSVEVSALGASDSQNLKAPPLAPPVKPVQQPFVPAKPLLAGAWGFVIALGLVFLALYFLALMLLLPGVRMRRERDLAKRIGMPAKADLSARDLGEKTLGAYLPTLVGMGDRLANAGGLTLSLEGKIERAGLPVTAGELVTASLLSAVFGVVVAGVTFQSVVFAVAGAFAFAAVPFVIVQVLARRRMSKLHEQLPDVLMILATSLRSGHSFLQALDTVSKEAADPGAKEFSRIVAEVRLGRSLEESMNAMADRVGSEDFRWAVLAVNIQREVGGNLAEVLDTVAETLRDRDNVRRQIDTLSSEGKLSLYILIALPIMIGLYIYKFSNDYLDPLLHSTGGLFMLGSAAILMVVGYIWMRKIVSIDV